MNEPDFLLKIQERHQLTLPQGLLQRLPKPWVMTNGVFDILHPGHVRYLAQAKNLGASLIVALNTDASAKRLGKGPDRPLNSQHDRAILLAALASVDAVTWFDEDTPVALLQEIRPEIYVKGGDYNMRVLAETKAVQSWGGQAQALPFSQGYSTTALVNKIKS